MEGRTHSWRIVAACLVALLLAGAIVHSDAGPPTARAQEADVGPAAATPVAVVPVPTAEPTATPEPTPEQSVVTLVVESTGTAFGLVTGTGELDSAAVGVTSGADATGAFYVKTGAIRITVTSDGPWTGTCAAKENSGSASPLRVGDGRLEWRLTGTEAWTPFVTNPEHPAAGVCFPARPIGTTTYVYDLRLRVERTDPPGTFAAAITFAVTSESLE